MGKLEQINISVSNPEKTAALLQTLFDWKIRWRGPSTLGGHTVHVETQDDYIALYCSDEPGPILKNSDRVAGGFNHIGVVVDDLDLIEQRVNSAGLTIHSHHDYEPGRRFYFNDEDGIEYEVVSYTGH